MKQLLKKNWLYIVLSTLLVIVSISFFYTLQTSEKTTAPVVADEKVDPATPAEDSEVPVKDEAKKTLFCLQIDNRQDGHLPALMGDKAQEAYPNGKDGFNWNLQWNSTGKEPYGILPDGTLFAKESFLMEWGMVSSVTVKCDDNWEGIVLQKASVNNEVAYTYKLK